MKAVQLLVNSFLPEDARDYSQTFDAKGLNKILYSVATNHPDKFADVLKNVSDIGRKASYVQGETISLKDLESPIDKKIIFEHMDAEISQLPPSERNGEKKLAIFQKYNDLIQKMTQDTALANRNNIAMTILSGARGKNPQLKAMITTPGTFSDYKGRVIPVFSKESFAEGIRPAVFLASTYGARSSVISAKSATAKGGDFSKQLASTAADMVIRKNDCGTSNGIEIGIDDKSLKGRVLAKDTKGVPAGTFITRDIIDRLRKSGVEHVVARSPLTCSVENGLCAHCVGKFYKGGKLPKIGDSIGLTASSVVGEPIAQGALSAKHTAGMSTGKKSYSGLEYIAQFTQSPEEFRDRAPLTDEDGVVESVDEAPQGGTYITVNGKKYYAGLGHEVLVKPGQTLEAGDQLAEGLIDPEDVVRTKGLGAGMLYYAKRLNQMLEDSSAGTDMRNTEVLARATMRHVKVDSNDGIGSYLPDDVVDYRALMKTYTPPETSKILKPSDAVGKYLQKPVLHYTVGTRITPSVAKDIERNDYSEVLADDMQPQFSPVMVRLRAASHTNPDWLASMSTSYLAKQLNESSTRGDDTNILHNTDFRPRLAVGAKFGENVRETGEF